MFDPSTPLASSSTTDFQQFIESLAESPDLASTALELEALQAIYGEEAFRLHDPTEYSEQAGEGRIRYEAILPLPENEDVSIKVLITIPPHYPDADHPPQLQLLDRYVGDFGVDSGLFGRILRTYFSIPPPDGDGVPFVIGEVAVWEGLEHVRNCCQQWYTSLLLSNHETSLLRNLNPIATVPAQTSASRPSSPPPQPRDPPPPPTDLPKGIEIHVAEPIVDRKSVFVGRAVRVTDPALVPIILNHLLADKKIAKAAHPIIHAYRIQGKGGAAGVMIQDNDDDGESAAGSRIAHLLQILEITNILLIVTRYFGGTHLGPDRFKHIGQAARDALEVGGFLDEPEVSSGGKGGGKGKGGGGQVKGGRR